jgi:uncharacterized membrane protein
MLALLLMLLPVVTQLFLLLYPGFKGRPVRAHRACVLATLLGLLTAWGAAELGARQQRSNNPHQVSCDMTLTAFLLLGLLITAVVLPAIAILYWTAGKLLVWYASQKQPTASNQ